MTRLLSAALVVGSLVSAGSVRAEHWADANPPGLRVTGTDRFFAKNHEIYTSMGASGLLIGSGTPRPQLLGVGYEEHAGTIADLLIFGLPRALGLSKDEERERPSGKFATFLALAAYLPVSDQHAYGGEFVFGASVRVGRLFRRPVVGQFAARIGFLGDTASGASRTAAMDALSLRLHAPVVRSVSVFVQWDANLYAVTNLGELKKWWRPSPLTVGARWDVAKWIFVAAEGTAVIADLGWRALGGVRF